jgi:hypothetical protein
MEEPREERRDPEAAADVPAAEPVVEASAQPAQEDVKIVV